jgi:hypothetical protein
MILLNLHVLVLFPLLQAHGPDCKVCQTERSIQVAGSQNGLPAQGHGKGVGIRDSSLRTRQYPAGQFFTLGLEQKRSLN